MREALRRPTHAAVSTALRNAIEKLRGRQDGALPDSCADLWDDSLELIELLIVIEEELQNGLRANHELDWQNAPKRTATTTGFICWIVKEMNHG